MSSRRPLIAVVGVLAMAALAACGSSSGKPQASAPTSATNPQVQRVAVPGAPPAQSSQMICNKEGQGLIASSLGVRPKPIKPTWRNEVYACDYVYPNGTMRLSVHELPNDAAAKAAFADLKSTLHGSPAATVLGQGTFTTSDDSVFVVKDNKLLDIDVKKLPATFGQPSLSRSDVALTVAVTIMGCWTGV